MRSVPLRHTRRPRLTYPSLAIAATLLLSGCYRAQWVPQAEPTTAVPLSEPRHVDYVDVPLQRDPTQTYRLGPSDVVRVDVPNDPDLGDTYAINNEGEIFIPILGSVKVSELTTTEASQLLNEKLEDGLIRDPQVRVGVEEYNSKFIYVIGQVRKPGKFVMETDEMSLQKAIFEAELPTRHAALNRVRVITPHYDQPVVYQIDVGDILYEGKMRGNMVLKPNDIVFVPSKYAKKLDNALESLLQLLNDGSDLDYYLSGDAFDTENENTFRNRGSSSRGGSSRTR